MPDREPRKQAATASKTADKRRPRHVADEPVAEAGSLDAGVKSPLTSTGLPVEEQVHKEWDPKKQGGLPIPLGRGAARTEVK
jgi:hypothetical protein